MIHFNKAAALLILVLSFSSIHAQEAEQEEKHELESPSPDGKFAFRYTGDSDDEKQTYDLVNQKTGKKVMSVAESNKEIGPSARFTITPLWRPDSKAFALTAFLWKRGTTLFVFVQDGAKFRKVTLPELEANVPDKEKKGKSFPHVAGLNSQEAKEWHKDGSLLVEIETMLDGGDGGSITARRTVLLGFDKSPKAKLLKSTIKFERETDSEADAQTARENGDVDGALANYSQAIARDTSDAAAYYHRGCAYFAKRDWAKALADFRRHCELRKDQPYQVFEARFYIWLIRARLGEKEAADKELAPYLEGHPAEWSNGWHARIGNFLLGKISEDDFLKSLSDDKGEAYFYVGMKRALGKDQETAAQDFKKSVAELKPTTDLHQMAAAELAAVGK